MAGLDPIPWRPYTNVSLRTVALCEETGRMAVEGRCPHHGGDACLFTYRHPYDNAVDRWKRAQEWRLDSERREASVRVASPVISDLGLSDAPTDGIRHTDNEGKSA